MDPAAGLHKAHLSVRRQPKSWKQRAIAFLMPAWTSLITSCTPCQPPLPEVPQEGGPEGLVPAVAHLDAEHLALAAAGQPDCRGIDHRYHLHPAPERVSVPGGDRGSLLQARIQLETLQQP
jgi:hypothetical protein